jgi:hypothetical protein
MLCDLTHAILKSNTTDIHYSLSLLLYDRQSAGTAAHLAKQGIFTLATFPNAKHA